MLPIYYLLLLQPRGAEPEPPAPEPSGGAVGGSRGSAGGARRRAEAMPMWLPPGPTGPTEAELRAERRRRQREEEEALLLCGALGGL